MTLDAIAPALLRFQHLPRYHADRAVIEIGGRRIQRPQGQHLAPEGHAGSLRRESGFLVPPSPIIRAMPRILALFLASLVALATPSAQQSASYDIVIRNGRVLDGMGNPWIVADVAIKDGRFVKIGRVTGTGQRELDAKGRYVSPGWIDMMDQSGGVLPRNGLAENKLRQGVTTAIGGEGGTPVPAARIPETRPGRCCRGARRGRALLDRVRQRQLQPGEPRHLRPCLRCRHATRFFETQCRATRRRWPRG